MTLTLQHNKPRALPLSESHKAPPRALAAPKEAQLGAAPTLDAASPLAPARSEEGHRLGALAAASEVKDALETQTAALQKKYSAAGLVLERDGDDQLFVASTKPISLRDFAVAVFHTPAAQLTQTHFALLAAGNPFITDQLRHAEPTKIALPAGSAVPVRISTLDGLGLELTALQDQCALLDSAIASAAADTAEDSPAQKALEPFLLQRSLIQEAIRDLSQQRDVLAATILVEQATKRVAAPQTNDTAQVNKSFAAADKAIARLMRGETPGVADLAARCALEKSRALLSIVSRAGQQPDAAAITLADRLVTEAMRSPQLQPSQRQALQQQHIECLLAAVNLDIQGYNRSAPTPAAQQHLLARIRDVQALAESEQANTLDTRSVQIRCLQLRASLAGASGDVALQTEHLRQAFAVLMGDSMQSSSAVLRQASDTGNVQAKLLALPLAEQQVAVQLLLAFAELSVSGGAASEFNTAVQLLRHLSWSRREPALDVAVSCYEAQQSLGKGDAAGARRIITEAHRSLASSSLASEAALHGALVLADAQALHMLAATASGDERTAAATALQRLCTTEEKRPKGLPQPELAKLRLLEASAWLECGDAGACNAVLLSLQTQYGNLAWVQTALQTFRDKNTDRGAVAALQVALKEASSDTVNEMIAYTAGGIATGAAVGVWFGGIGGLAGAAKGALWGMAIGVGILKVKNVIAANQKIVSAYRTGLNNLSWQQSVADGASLAADLLPVARTAGGAFRIGKAGLAAMRAGGSFGEAALANVVSRFERALLESGAASTLTRMAPGERVRFAQQWLLQEFADGGRLAAASTVIAVCAGFAPELVRVLSDESLSPAERSQATDHWLRGVAQAVLTMGALSVPTQLLQQVSRLPAPMRSAAMTRALRDLANAPAQVSVHDGAGLRARIDASHWHARRSVAHDPQALTNLDAHYARLRADNVAFYDRVTGQVHVDASVLAKDNASNVIAHELVHQRFGSLSPAKQHEVIESFRQHENWKQIEVEASKHPELAQLSASQLVDELLAIRIGDDQTRIALLVEPIMQGKAVRSVGLHEVPRVDLAALKANGSVRVAKRSIDFSMDKAAAAHTDVSIDATAYHERRLVLERKSTLVSESELLEFADLAQNAKGLTASDWLRDVTELNLRGPQSSAVFERLRSALDERNPSAKSTLLEHLASSHKEAASRSRLEPGSEARLSALAKRYQAAWEQISQQRMPF